MNDVSRPIHIPLPQVVGALAALYLMGTPPAMLCVVAWPLRIKWAEIAECAAQLPDGERVKVGAGE